ncbi:xanthine dehydrogenase family protein molybdopterin-binding subunit [Pedobacter frigidisoli]|uniref:Xanthine dehydrogenase family protein molybdopterin-binding subunit n=1 Tax=Pedobacter frigidisoli TaxID=2530455 RepID=A0A4R0ND04_9SPHI|nr:xanthine dehydrogenase family protein molybdopterin-binding subunit [Pedobacter frigidisoli]TCC98128.1 xanthine dehydrogenase family protein molybdopterin-binding subunit [Pedobacter frigidisoli]
MAANTPNQNTNMAIIGKPLDRVDGHLKVTGIATFVAEFNQPNMAYAFPVRSTIAKGSITGFDLILAEKSGGVISILTHENAPRLQPFDPLEIKKTGGFLAENLIPLQDNKVHYFGQFIAVVLAETFEEARHAATLVKVSYAKEKADADLNEALLKSSVREGAQLNKGQASAIIETSNLKIEQTYTTPAQNHHPMEPHAAIAIWDGADKLTLYDSTQVIVGMRNITAYFFKLKPEDVRILCPYLGGGFGGKSPAAHNILAAMAGKKINRPVKLVITRQMMQTNVGRRSPTIQKVALACDLQGKLTVIRHQNSSYSNLTDFSEPVGIQTQVLYNAPVREITHQIAKLDMNAPTYMRAPGHAVGSFALESAIDEMAYELRMDPVQFRILNHASTDPVKKINFSSNHLLECFQIGVEKFGWASRKIQPRQTRNGQWLVGYGMATSVHHGVRRPATVRIQLSNDGMATVMTASQELGTGTYTILTQTAADALGIAVGKIKVLVGDSDLPPAPFAAGSSTTASVNPAVLAAGELLRCELMRIAIADPKSKLNGRNTKDISFADSKLYLSSDISISDSYKDIMRRNNRETMQASATATPGGAASGATVAPCGPSMDQDQNYDTHKYSFHSFGAHFVEVWVDEDLGTIRVKRVTTVQDIGRVMNEKTARSQVIGGVIFGIGAALMEETVFDNRWASPVTRTLADYHVPVNLDVPPIDVHFIGKPDPHISSIGSKGVGEVGIVGVSAAIANAVFNATGKRLRNLPFTPDKLFV